MLELAKTPAHAGRRPFLDAEQLGLEQRLDQRRAVDGDKWPAAPAADLVNLSRDELLPRSRLAFDQHSEVRHRDALDAATQHLHDAARANQRRDAVDRAGDARYTATARLEDEPRELRRRREKVHLQLSGRRAGVEGGLEQTLHAWIGGRHTHHDRLRRSRRRHQPRVVARGQLAQPHDAHTGRTLHFAFERAVEIAFHGIAGQRVAERSQNFSDEIIEPFHVVLRPRITKCSATLMSASEAQADKRSVNSMSPANSRSG